MHEDIYTALLRSVACLELKLRLFDLGWMSVSSDIQVFLLYSMEL